MKHIFTSFLLPFFLLASCASPSPVPAGVTLRVQYTASAAPWLADLSGCADQTGVVLQADPRLAGSLDLTTADLAIRLGDSNIASQAYQVGTDELLVIVNRQNPTGPLSATRVRALFTGQVRDWKEINATDSPVQVWAFPSSEDVEQAFESITLAGSPVTPAARLATTPDEMSQAIANNANAIGFLPRRWKMGNVSEVFIAATLPALILIPSAPQDAVGALIACIQK